MHDSNHKGNVAEAAIAFHAAKLDIPVFTPLTEHCRYDLVLEIGGQLQRVQCKWAPRRGDVIPVNFVTNRRGPEGFVRSTYTAGEIDAVAAYCEELDTCYYLPIDRVAGKTAIQLRLVPPKNAQRASLTFAADHTLGAVAQWEERRRGTAEAGGSSPPSSTPSDSSQVEVGAHEFRNRFGWYMQRAAAGERLLVTRRGKPYVRLIRADDRHSSLLLQESARGAVTAI